jgi:hypothetical protein
MDKRKGYVLLLINAGVRSSVSERKKTRHSDRSPLEEQFCVFKIFKMSAIFKMAAKTRHKNGG